MNSTSSTTLSATGVAQAGLNILLAMLLVVLAVASYQHFSVSHSTASFGILLVNALFLGLFITRPKAKSETPSLPLWLLATTAVALPMLLRPTVTAGHWSAGYAIQVAGLVMLVGSTLSLNRGFAIVPGNRGVRDGGFYRIVRHPLYVSELTVFLGVVVANPTTANLIIWACECGLQFVRALAEEDFLSADPRYVAYRQRVRYRLIPGLL